MKRRKNHAMIDHWRTNPAYLIGQEFYIRWDCADKKVKVIAFDTKEDVVTIITYVGLDRNVLAISTEQFYEQYFRYAMPLPLNEAKAPVKIKTLRVSMVHINDRKQVALDLSRYISAFVKICTGDPRSKSASAKYIELQLNNKLVHDVRYTDDNMAELFAAMIHQIYANNVVVVIDYTPTSLD